MKTTDVQIANEGTVFAFELLTTPALEWVEEHCAEPLFVGHTLVVEHRFARDLAVQIAGHDLMKARGYELVPVDAPDYFTDETPTAVMVRQLLGAVAQFEKASLVQKLRKARERRKAVAGKCEGRKSLAELHPEAVKLAKRLRRKSPKTSKRRSFREIAQMLAQDGHLNENGANYSPRAIKAMAES